MRDRYVIITPCRDEADFARKTLDSVAAQTIQPALWVIVDDGSKDGTPALLAEYAAKYEFIRVVRRERDGGRKVGPGTIDAFYAGMDTIDLADYDFICKLDLDLILPPAYFEQLMLRMHQSPRLGTCSGKAYYVGESGELISEGIGDDVSVGASKFYRRECFEQIGGFVRQVMWDGIDCHRCRMLGWIACSWDDEDIRFVHLRPMGTSHKGIWTGRKRWGYGQYFMGSSLAYLTASALYRMTRPPYVIGGVAIWWGYVHAMLTRQARYDDAEFRRFLRKYQWSCLLNGKSRAVEQLNKRQANRWRSPQDMTSGHASPRLSV